MKMIAALLDPAQTVDGRHIQNILIDGFADAGRVKIRAARNDDTVPCGQCLQRLVEFRGSQIG